jgi:hypothetical protein
MGVLDGSRQRSGEQQCRSVQRGQGCFSGAVFSFLRIPCRKSIALCVTFIGHPYDEARLIALGSAWQGATVYHEKRPTLEAIIEEKERD